MAEYIDRQAAIDSLLGWAAQLTETYGKNDEYVRCLESAAYNIEQIPTADVRPVVLCRDCRDSYEWSNVDGDSYRYCGYLRSRWNHDIDRMVDDDDYCKWGQKREES